MDDSHSNPEFCEKEFCNVANSHGFTMLDSITGKISRFSKGKLGLTIIRPSHMQEVDVYFYSTHVRVYVLRGHWDYNSFYTPSDLDRYLTCLSIMLW